MTLTSRSLVALSLLVCVSSCANAFVASEVRDVVNQSIWIVPREQELGVGQLLRMARLFRLIAAQDSDVKEM